MGSREILTLRQQALEALQKSTKMLEQAFELLRRGKRVEGERVLNEARTQRTISTFLMAESNSLPDLPAWHPNTQPQPSSQKAYS